MLIQVLLIIILLCLLIYYKGIYMHLTQLFDLSMWRNSTKPMTHEHSQKMRYVFDHQVKIESLQVNI